MKHWVLDSLEDAKDTINRGDKLAYLIVVIRRPEGAHEIITNTDKIPEKIDYYLNAYDEEARLKACKDIIIDGILWG